MIAILSSGLTGVQNQATRLSVIANNLANVSTTGFKKSRVQFQDVAYQYANSGSVGGGVTVGSIDKIFNQASLAASGGSVDLSIEGDGFFQLTRPDGTVVFTRDGAFNVDGMGRIVNSSGYVLNPQITVPANASNISVSEDGTVSVTLPGAAGPQALGRIQLVTFSNPGGLESLGNNTFAQTANSGAPTQAPAGVASMVQGYLEMSNVDIVEEMTNMMLVQRAYEANIKVIKAGDEMFAATINLLK